MFKKISLNLVRSGKFGCPVLSGSVLWRKIACTIRDAIYNIYFYKQEFAISNVQQELNYVRKELIEARANKSASDDKLNNVQDQIDTMQNNINSLTDEGNF